MLLLAFFLLILGKLLRIEHEIRTFIKNFAAKTFNSYTAYHKYTPMQASMHACMRTHLNGPLLVQIPSILNGRLYVYISYFIHHIHHIVQLNAHTHELNMKKKIKSNRYTKPASASVAAAAAANRLQRYRFIVFPCIVNKNANLGIESRNARI